MAGLSQIVHTIRYLKPRQFVYQLIRRIEPAKRVAAVNGSLQLRKGVALSEPLRRPFDGEETIFRFLNVTQSFDPAQVDWRAAQLPKLWRYNLHYFDYLQHEERSWESKAALVDSWIKSNPQGLQDAWEPFPVSLRIVNWIKFFLSSESAGKLDSVWLQSLYNQARWLSKKIEYHLMGNHYFKNGKALFFAGCVFAGPEPTKWLKRGVQILISELDEQILADGGHFERSPMYHAMVLEDCLDLLNICQKGTNNIECPKRLLRQKARDMMEFLMGVRHPDGNIPLFNDAALGMEASPQALISYFERLTGEKIARDDNSCHAFPQTGYFIISPTEDDRLIIDCGPIGPDYQPGHSHCDTLSFELSLNGRRLVVDSGCCQYEDAEIRRYNRGNKGHNTITIDGKNQSEVWGAHRCARRSYPINPRMYAEIDGAIVFEGGHDGYRRLRGKPIHHRNIRWADDEIRIEDRIEGKGYHDVESRLHINPELQCVFKENSVEIICGKLRIATITALGEASIGLEKGWYCPEFGIKHLCQVICLNYKNEALPFKTGWCFKIHRS